MKTITQKLKVYKEHKDIIEELQKKLKGNIYVILYENGRWEFADDKSDFNRALRNDYKDKIYAIFDDYDKYSINRTPIIDINELKEDNNETIQ